MQAELSVSKSWIDAYVIRSDAQFGSAPLSLDCRTRRGRDHPRAVKGPAQSRNLCHLRQFGVGSAPRQAARPRLGRPVRAIQAKQRPNLAIDPGNESFSLSTKPEAIVRGQTEVSLHGDDASLAVAGAKPDRRGPVVVRQHRESTATKFPIAHAGGHQPITSATAIRARERTAGRRACRTRLALMRGYPCGGSRRLPAEQVAMCASRQRVHDQSKRFRVALGKTRELR